MAFIHLYDITVTQPQWLSHKSDGFIHKALSTLHKEEAFAKSWQESRQISSLN